jgi:hypothetical protein
MQLSLRKQKSKSDKISYLPKESATQSGQVDIKTELEDIAISPRTYSSKLHLFSSTNHGGPRNSSGCFRAIEKQWKTMADLDFVNSATHR